MGFERGPARESRWTPGTSNFQRAGGGGLLGAKGPGIRPWSSWGRVGELEEGPPGR